MSIWHEIKKQEDVQLSDDRKTLEVCYGYDRDGNLYIDIPIEYVKAALTDAGSNAFSVIELWNKATKLSLQECNGYWKALRDLEKLGIVKVDGLDPD